LRITWIALVTLAAPAALVPVASAARPTVTITPWDRTRTLAAGPAACPFPIVIHSSGTFRETVFSSGRDVTTVSDFHITYSNPASGRSLTSVLAGPVIVEPNGDGTVTVTVNGNDGLFTGPGYSFLFGDVGHLVYIAAADDLATPLVIFQSSGHQDPSPFPAVCPALA
jgi:hypothetical protein